MSLFAALLCHGYTAECLCDSIIQPIPKGLKDPAISSKCPGIALASCLSKLLELCFLMSFSDVFCSSNLCSLNTKNFSTDLCTGLLKLVSFPYIHHGSKFNVLCSEWWRCVAYLGYRLPVPVHSSPAIGYPRQPSGDEDTYVRCKEG